MNEVDIINSCLKWFEQKTELNTLIEPQQIEPVAPTLRFMITGFTEQGENREKIKATATLNAYGEGPMTFLKSVAAASRKMIKLTERSNAFDILNTENSSATVTFTKLGDGGFQENDSDIAKYPFLWVEQYTMEISYNKSLLD